MTLSCSLSLQICLIIALSFHCRCWRFGFVSCQVSLALSIELLTQELYTWPHALKERWRKERTRSSSWNFFQAVFIGVVVKVHSHWLLRACLQVANGSYHLQLVRSDLDFLFWSAIQRACSYLAPCTSVIRVLCQAPEPTAFLVHPELAAIAEDAIAAHSSATDGTRKLA